ncbi:hypothetical protein KDH_11460 [Dictyobacter sp. S3.2.2.5]|uniref:Uncharacterized protein n=1 Tax=Dictyobacter halimunensis TaxID=3026934 RepID=A0ABQ6FMP9_9CHLR|nr:hypothetical protein KDH_11460 [Dictyobacter sp. S3.2.2.5]
MNEIRFEEAPDWSDLAFFFPALQDTKDSKNVHTVDFEMIYVLRDNLERLMADIQLPHDRNTKGTFILPG